MSINIETSDLEIKKILIVEDHPSVITGTLEEIKKIFTHFKGFTATTATDARQIINKKEKLDLAIVDLRIPNQLNDPPSSEFGLAFLSKLMRNYPNLNIVIQTADMSVLIAILPEIENHDGGIVISSKSLSSKDMRKRITWALDGVTHTKELRKELNLDQINLKPTWYQVLQLAFEEGLIDSEIAKKMAMSEPNIRRIWEKIYDALDIEKVKGTNLRIRAYNRAMQLNYIKPPT